MESKMNSIRYSLFKLLVKISNKTLMEKNGIDRKALSGMSTIAIVYIIVYVYQSNKPKATANSGTELIQILMQITSLFECVKS